MLTTILKEQTLAAHQALEKILISHLKAIDITGDYLKLLKWFYNFYAPLERQILHHLPSDLIDDYRLRRKSDLLINDIQSLNGDMNVQADFTKPIVSINNVAEALGAMYVLEGSTLGGSVISKLIMNRLPACSEANVTFFLGYGSETMAMWERFKLILNHYPLDDSQKDSVINSANQTFIKFKQSIN